MDDADAPPDFDMFYHYDSTSTVLEDAIMRIRVPCAGFYYISLSNIYIALNPNSPPTGTAFLAMEKFESINGGSCITGNPKQSNKVLFPLSDPALARPSCRVYNRILLATEDTITFNYYDLGFTKYPMSQMVATIHISSNPDIIRLTV